MIRSLRKKLSTPSGKYALALMMLTGGIRLLVETIREESGTLAELVELHADTRTRIFAFETIREGEQVIDGSHDVVEETDQPTTEESSQ